MDFIATATAKENACVIKCKQILFKFHARSVRTYINPSILLQINRNISLNSSDLWGLNPRVVAASGFGLGDFVHGRGCVCDKFAATPSQ